MAKAPQKLRSPGGGGGGLIPQTQAGGGGQTTRGCGGLDPHPQGRLVKELLAGTLGSSATFPWGGVTGLLPSHRNPHALKWAHHPLA